MCNFFRILMLSLVCQLAVPNTVLAAFFDGNYLKKLMNGSKSDGQGTVDDDPYRSAYVGYVVGVYDAYENVFFCPTKDVTIVEVVDKVTKFIHETPEALGVQASWVVRLALTPAYPCKN